MTRSTFTLALVLALALPVAGLAQDSDGDGVPDASDAFPCDSAAVAEAYAPALGVHGQLMAEDFWPQRLDDDYQDAVVAYHYAFALDAAGRVVALEATFEVRAAGGVTDIGFGLQLPLPRSAVESVSAVRGGQTWPVMQATDAALTLVLSSDVRGDFFGASAAQIVNADPATPRLDGLGPIKVQVRLLTPQVVDLAAAPFDLYIFDAIDPTREVHQSAYCGTSNVDQSLFGTGIDASTASRCYVDAQGLPAVVAVPKLVDYPAEENDIAAVFPQIVSWASSGGTQDAAWYDQPSGVAHYPNPIAPGFEGVARMQADLSCPCPSGYTGTAGACQPNTPAGLFARWSFDEGSGGQVLDGSGNGWHGTHNGQYVAGVRGTALYFTATRATIPSHSSFIWGENDTPYTMEYWMNVGPATGSWRSVVHKSPANYPRNPASFLYTTDMGFYPVHGTVANNNDHVRIGPVPTNRWVFFAETYDPATSTKRYYLDGVEVATKVLTSPMAGNTAALLIGWDGYYGALNGAIDEVRVYRRALSAAEILYDFNNP